MFQKISQKIEDITFTGFYSISGYLRNLRGRLLSSEKFSEVFTLWVFTLKPFPVREGESLMKVGQGPLFGCIITLRKKHPHQAACSPVCGGRLWEFQGSTRLGATGLRGSEREICL